MALALNVLETCATIPPAIKINVHFCMQNSNYHLAQWENIDRSA